MRMAHDYLKHDASLVAYMETPNGWLNKAIAVYADGTVKALRQRRNKEKTPVVFSWVCTQGAEKFIEMNPKLAQHRVK